MGLDWYVVSNSVILRLIYSVGNWVIFGFDNGPIIAYHMTRQNGKKKGLHISNEIKVNRNSVKMYTFLFRKAPEGLFY